MELFLPQYVKNCISVLEKAGFEAYCVGGAVRDLIMGLEPSDFDVTTNCPPNMVEKLFDRTIPTGIEHGTVTVLIDGNAIEVTTYRTEGGYSDARHPDKVTFVGNIEDDLARRDFTVNAIAYNERRGFFDPFSGIEDIAAKRLRTVGEARLRFSEDALRIMRLYRFASQLGFEIEADTLIAAQELLPLLEKISVERIFSELCKTLLGKRIEKATDFFSRGGLEFLGIERCDIAPLSSLPRERSIRFAALIKLSGSSAECLKNLKCDNLLKDEAGSLLSLLNGGLPEDKIALKRALCSYGEGIIRKGFPLFSVLCALDCGAAEKALDEIINGQEPYRLSHLAISGEDIKAAGYNGREIGNVLSMLLERIWADPSLNTREKLIEIITK